MYDKHYIQLADNKYATLEGLQHLIDSYPEYREYPELYKDLIDYIVFSL